MSDAPTVEAASTGPSTSAPSAPTQSAPSPSTPAPSAPAPANGSPAPASPAAPKAPRTQRAAPNPSLTTPKPVASDQQSVATDGGAPASQTGQPAEDPVKHLRDQLSLRGREQAALRAQYDQTQKQLAELQKFRQEQMAKAQRAQLKRWDPKHPEHTGFEQTKAKIAWAREMASKIQVPEAPAGLAPEQAQAWKESYLAARKQEIASSIDPKDWEEHQAYEQDQKQFLAKFHTDPRAAFRDEIRAEIKAEMEAAQVSMKAEQEVDADFQDPEFGQFLQTHRDQVAEVVSKLGGTDEAYEVARHMGKLYMDNQKLYKQLAELSQQSQGLAGKAQEARVKQDLIKRKASITADPRQPPAKPIFLEAKEWAEKNGHSTVSEAFQRKVSELTNRRHGRS